MASDGYIDFFGTGLRQPLRHGFMHVALAA